MAEIIQIELPLMYLGGVNVWLLPDDPLTLVDAGPATEEAFASLEDQLHVRGVAIEDVEQVMITHHHLDHSGLATAIKERSGARILAHRGTARWGLRVREHGAAERRFTLALIAAHGAPEPTIRETAEYLDRMFGAHRAFRTDLILSEGDTVRAGGRDLRTVFRPGHSSTDTLFVDESYDAAFVGDHLLANITSGVELMPTALPGDERRRGLLDYLANLRKTQAMRLGTCYPGHGPTIPDHRALIDDRLAFHSNRLRAIGELIDSGCRTAFDIARRLWSDETAMTQPVLVIWEVLGHLDVLVNRGTVREEIDDAGRHLFRPMAPAQTSVPRPGAIALR
jgi:glyoxylase-like metal-dependent hydrolase (beta-lactamase superfamily II)